MINVRLFFVKTGDSRYLSHLDLMRCFTRAIKCSGLDVWYTQGFNTHMYLMFSCPLSLGYESLCEACDIRLLNDEDINKDVAGLINKGLPKGVEIFKVAEPVMKHTDIEYSRWRIVFREEDERAAGKIRDELNRFFSQDEIIVTRKSKRGEHEENALPLIKRVSFELEGTCCIFEAVLSQNVEKALNPRVILNAFTEKTGIETELCEITKLEMMDKKQKSYC